LVEKTVDDVKKIMEKINCKFVVGVSLDGPSDIHIKSRGISDGWNKTVSTFLKIRDMKEEFSNLDAHINHFISPINILHFNRFIDELREKGIGIDEISIEVARNSPFFMNEGIEIENNKQLLLRLLKNIDKLYASSKKTLRSKLRRRYVQEMMSFLNGHKTIPCASSYSSIYIDPYGFVYPCSQLKIAVGNLKDLPIKTLMTSRQMIEWRKEYHNCQICWSGCEGMTSMIQNLPFSII